LYAYETAASLTISSSPGMHILKLYIVDPGVMIDKIAMDAGGLRPSYLGPPETRISNEARVRSPAFMREQIFVFSGSVQPNHFLMVRICLYTQETQ
jgi:hypothetical protein